MPVRKGGSVRSHTRKVRTSTGGTKTVSVKGSYRKSGITKSRKK